MVRRSEGRIQFGDLKSEVQMSKEEIRRELCIYDGHTFEDSPPATKKAKYQPGRRSTVALYVSSTHVLLQTWYLVLIPRLFPVFSGEEPGYEASL